MHPKNTTIKTNKLRKTGGAKDSASAVSVNSNSNQTNDEVSREPIQCLGPECVNESKENSKYCSIECGLRLAKSRFLHFLRERFDERILEQPSHADKLNKEALQKINIEIDTLNKKLGELEQKHVELDKIIERAKFASINPNVEVNV